MHTQSPTQRKSPYGTSSMLVNRQQICRYMYAEIMQQSWLARVEDMKNMARNVRIETNNHTVAQNFNEEGNVDDDQNAEEPMEFEVYGDSGT